MVRPCAWHEVRQAAAIFVSGCMALLRRGAHHPPRRGREAAANSGLQLEHFAFSAVGLKDFLARLHEHKVRYDARKVPRSDGVQINVWDPDGNHIHIDFEGAETAGVEFKEVDATAMAR